MTTDIKKIVLFGPESTGKSYLAQALATHYHTRFVPEYARTYLELKHQLNLSSLDANSICTTDDIFPIVSGQILIEDEIIKHAHYLLLCDTNPLQTAVYVQYYYNNTCTWLENIINERVYHHYLLLNTDVPWVQDPLRDRPHHRQEIFNLFEKTLAQRGHTYTIVSGNYKQRTELCIQTIDRLLAIEK
ncbi:MAG: ATP-binding protein [Cytophagales bacterium]|nr:ATP-binding protein [Cytophagales bacterium]